MAPVTTDGPFIVRLDVGGEIRWAVRTDGVDRPLPMGLDDLLRLPRDQARATVDAAAAAEPVQGDLLAPVESQEVWGGRRHLRAQPGRPGRRVHRGGR